MEKQSVENILVKSTKAALVFRALNNKLRRTILFYLLENPDTDVKALYNKFRLLQSTTSHHLGILRKQHLVQAKQQGKQMLYSVNLKRLEEVESICDRLLVEGGRR